MMGVSLKKASSKEKSVAEQIGVVFPNMEEVLVSSLKNHTRNSRDHDEMQLSALVSSIKEWGWTIPVVINEEGVILAGHGRAEAARRAKLKKVTAVRVKGWDDFKQRAYMLADNQLALMSYWDWGILSSEVDFLQESSYSLDLLGMSDSARASLSAFKMSSAPAPLPGSTGVPGSMSKKFGMAPFSVVSVGDPWWLQEKGVWLSHGMVGTSMCCLLDICLRWFCPAGGGVVGVEANPEFSKVVSEMGYKVGGDFAFLDLYTEEAELSGLKGACKKLNKDRFLAVVLHGNASPKLWDSLISSAREVGLRYYNEIVIDGMGGQSSGIIACHHVFVLLFVKGDERVASEVIGTPNMTPLLPVELAGVPVEDDPYALTPVITVGDVYMKRDDYFAVGTARGGKVRSCLLLSQGATGLVTAGSRASPQVNIVAQVAKKLGVPARAHLPQGELSPCVEETKEDIELVQHKAGYNNVIVKRARDDAAKSGWREVPFGMETELAISCTREQVKNIPEDTKRIIMPVGSGMSLAGVLWGLVDAGLDIPVFGVSVGADPTERLNKYAPTGWQNMVEIVKSDLDYHDPAPETIFRGVQLDPIYESKVIPFVQPGDLFWVVGIRSVL